MSLKQRLRYLIDVASWAPRLSPPPPPPPPKPVSPLKLASENVNRRLKEQGLL